jgi:hypothetical protein
VLSEREAALQVAAEEASEALRVVQLRHREGDVELLDVLTFPSSGPPADGIPSRNVPSTALKRRDTSSISRPDRSRKRRK